MSTIDLQATKFPANAYWYLTQIVGKKYEDPAVEQFQKRFPYYNIIKDEERGTILFQLDEYVSTSQLLFFCLVHIYYRRLHA